MSSALSNLYQLIHLTCGICDLIIDFWKRFYVNCKYGYVGKVNKDSEENIKFLLSLFLEI